MRDGLQMFYRQRLAASRLPGLQCLYRFPDNGTAMNAAIVFIPAAQAHQASGFHLHPPQGCEQCFSPYQNGNSPSSSSEISEISPAAGVSESDTVRLLSPK